MYLKIYFDELTSPRDAAEALRHQRLTVAFNNALAEEYIEVSTPTLADLIVAHATLTPYIKSKAHD